MKKLVQILKWVDCSIKKNFFIVKKTDNCHKCEKVLGIAENLNSGIPEKEFEEYLNSYRNITRWQTV